jgi:hypothetical protein
MMSDVTAPPNLERLLSGADHVDVKSIESDLSLREFIAGAMTYQPSWLRGLFATRVVFAKLLRLDQPSLPKSPPIRPDLVSFRTGDQLSFFTVVDGEEDRYVVYEAADTHLVGYLALLRSPSESGKTTLNAITVVKYRRWTGPVYFNVIRPFHHLVVAAALHAGAKGYRA